MNACLVPSLLLKRESKKGLGMATGAKGAPATERTGFTVIWHTVKDPRNLHSDCVPVGWAELRSLAMLLLAPIPKLASALLRELEGAWSVSSLWRAATSPSPQHTAAYTLTCLHTQQKLESSSAPLLSFQSFTSQTGFHLSGFLCRNREGFTSV